MPARLETFSEGHLERVFELEQAIFSGRDPWARAVFAKELGAPQSLWLVALKDEVCAGYAGGWVVGEEFHLLNLGVAPQFRRQGIGRALLVEILRRAAGRSCRTCLLEVRDSNAAARALYEKEGFCVRAVRKGYYSNGEDALLYSKMSI